MPEVYIDGVKYVPDRDVQPANARAIKIALMQKFWGDCSRDSDEALDEKWKGVYVRPEEDIEPCDKDCYFTIEQLLDAIADITAQIHKHIEL